MMRSNVPTDARAGVVKVLCMLVVLAAVTGLLIHSVWHGDATSVVSVPSHLGLANQMP